ncbi:metal-dependent hydrolase [Halorussus amylolyticus]|uniref:metal-dependent hydrolase n=1 Tax=Halorussus amylolyticus TaxID=1126242 RepID=UPI00104FF705|nr:metal-dependent hydrolase [Halorussus amylolyticus]
MPSTVVHVALAGLVGTALLADDFDGRSILVVMAATAFLDLDVFVGLVIPGTHRAAFHTLLLPVALGAILAWDVRVRGSERSRVRARWGGRGVRVGWVTLVAVTFAGIGLDLFFNGVNLFYPVYDRFYTVSGELLYSNQRGLVQTFVEFDFLTEEVASGGQGETVRTTENTHYRTGVDPSRGRETENVERIFPVAMSGERLLLALTGYTVVGIRLWQERRS